MQDDDTWTLKDYCPSGSDETWFFMKNVSASTRISGSSFQHAVRIAFRFEATDEAGEPLENHARLLSDIERIDIARMRRDGVAVLVGVTTRPGIRELFLYTRDPTELRRTVGGIQDATPELEVDCSTSRDPEWKQYNEFP